jgi:branched-chain amino acid transport system ATP-binding protein
MSDVAGTILLIVLIIAVILWAWALADAFGHPKHEWNEAGKNRTLWIAVLIPFGLVVAPVYLVVVRPALAQAIQHRVEMAREPVEASVLDDVEPVPGVAKPDPILVVDDLSRRFGGLVAVNVDHVEIQRGLITGLIGPNGAGKTTFFNLLTGFDTPDSGTSIFDGMDMAGLHAHAMASRGMVRTFQLTKALARMTVLDNMMLGATHQTGENVFAALVPPIWDGKEAEVRKRALSLLDRFDIGHMAEEYAGSMSGGQRKLLEMARALMTEPDLVMLDEPMAGVNPALTQSLLEHVKELRDEGMSVIFVEHDMDVVRDISDWVVVMAEGAIIAEGSHESVTGNRQVIDAYLGSQHDDPVVAGSEGA